MYLWEDLSSADQVRGRGGWKEEERLITLSQIKSRSFIFWSNCLDYEKTPQNKKMCLHMHLFSYPLMYLALGTKPQTYKHTLFVWMREGLQHCRETVCCMSQRPADMRWWCQYILCVPSGRSLCITLKHELYEWNNAVLGRDVNQKGEKLLTSFAIKR